MLRLSLGKKREVLCVVYPLNLSCKGAFLIGFWQIVRVEFLALFFIRGRTSRKPLFYTTEYVFKSLVSLEMPSPSYVVILKVREEFVDSLWRKVGNV